jgi:dimethylglycine dehydrogenase
MGVLRESDGSWYMREEAGGLLLGPYEKGAPCCYVDGPRDDAEYELFQEDLERLEPHIEAAINRVPAFGEVGIKQVYNGAIAYTPDGSPIIGPAWGMRNFWLNEGHSFGITAAGGAGWQLAEWIVEGEPTIDMLGVDPRRFGDYASKAYLRKKNEEAYANVFTIHYPDEERHVGRPLRMAPCYDRMKALGRCSATSSAGSAQTGSRPRARRGRTTGRSAARSGSSTSATNAATSPRMSACST